jgi:hypothetical protein
MKISPIVNMLFGLLVLGLCISPIAATISSTHLEQANSYRNNRHLVTVEITKPDNTKVDLEVPFMAMELEQSKTSFFPAR